MAVILFGAAGDVGRAVVEQFRAIGQPLTAVRMSGAEGSEGPISWRDCDMRDMRAVRRLVQPGDTVIQTVAARPFAAVDELPARLHGLMAGILHRNVRLICLDNFLPYGLLTPVFREGTHYLPHDGAARCRAELGADLARFAATNGTEVTILRAGEIYGPRLRGGLLPASVWRAVGRGRAVAFPLPVDVPQPLYPVEDVARGLMLLAQSPVLPGLHVLHLPLAAPVSVAELVGMAAQAMSSRARARQLPDWIARAVRPLSARWRYLQDGAAAMARPIPVSSIGFEARLRFVPTPHETAILMLVQRLQM